MENKKKYRVLVVDDSISDIDTLMSLLQKDYMVTPATNGERALMLANKEPQPDMILLNADMPDMDGLKVCQKLKDSDITNNIPIIFMTADNGPKTDYSGIALGALDYLTKPLNPSLVKMRVRNCFNLVALQNTENDSNDEVTDKGSKIQKVLLEALGKLADHRRNKKSRVNKIQLYVKTLAETLLASSNDKRILNKSMIESLCNAVPLFDIGMVDIRDDIVLAPNSLNDDEYGKVKRHPTFGLKFLQEIETALGSDPFIEIAQEIAYSHHERWDGSGYPKGLKGEEIPLSARILAIADVYDALISKQAYRGAKSHQEAVSIIEKSAGTHFDPELVNVFLDVESTLLEIAIRYAAHNEERKALQEALQSRKTFAITRILVVEDNEVMRTVVQSQLEKLDFIVTTAIHGEQAMTLIKQPNFYDLILTDINMPVMNGYKLLESIQGMELNIPVVAMTASDLELTQSKARGLGFSARLLKPFEDKDITQLMTTVSGNSIIKSGIH